jgi:hypothetical protein
LRNCSAAQQLNSNFTVAAGKSMPRRIDDELVDDHSEAPTRIRPQPQRLGRKHKLDFPMIEIRSTD